MRLHLDQVELGHIWGQDFAELCGHFVIIISDQVRVDGHGYIGPWCVPESLLTQFHRSTESIHETFVRVTESMKTAARNLQRVEQRTPFLNYEITPVQWKTRPRGEEQTERIRAPRRKKCAEMLSEIPRQRELAIGIVGFRSLDLAIPDCPVYGNSRLGEVDVLCSQATEFAGAKSCFRRLLAFSSGVASTPPGRGPRFQEAN